MNDNVNHPAHYTAYNPEVIDVAEKLGFCEGNIVKYLARAGRKPGVDADEDIRKASWYMRRLSLDERGDLDWAALVAATGRILATIAGSTPPDSGPWQAVYDAADQLALDVANTIESEAWDAI